VTGAERTTDRLTWTPALQTSLKDADSVPSHDGARAAKPDEHKSAPLTHRLTEVALRYQQMLAVDPQKPEALTGMSLVALASRQTEAAVKMARAATAAAPRMGAAWVTLGQALKTAERFAEAEQAYDQAIRLDGMDPLARMALGELKIATGRAQEAIAEFERALARRPTLVPSLLGLGNALAFLGKNAEALVRYEAVLALQPRLAEAEFAAGFALARLGRVADAERRYRRALATRPDFAAAWVNLGALLRDEGRDVAAEAALRRAAELRPDLISAWVNLGILEKERNRPDHAEKYLRRAFALDPAQPETLVAWYQFRAVEKDRAGAWSWLRWALAANPDFEEALNMHGILLHQEARFDEAIAAFERAEALGHRSAASNRGNSLLELGRLGEALHAHETAVQCDATSAGAQYNLALTQLRLGDWKNGWTNYEARWQFREVHRRPTKFKQPRWRGEALNGARILLHAEQGLGDTIQFCRYAAMVAARGSVPILQVQPATERLMHSLDAVRTGRAEVAVLGADSTEFALECPLMSLPAVFETTVETVPWGGAYLGPCDGSDAELAAQKLAAQESQRAKDDRKRDDAAAGPSRLRIGLAWAGNPRYKADAARSVHLRTLIPLLREVDGAWISLQKGEAAAHLLELPGDISVQDASSADRDLADTAALVAALDLVITTDTCIAHLAGAMGKPVWILLPHLADWRWMEERETTPWYPTARLFRQSSPGDWAGVIERVSWAARQVVHGNSIGGRMLP
jgi:tetratricopeptide (TPR) repeat protein